MKGIDGGIGMGISRGISRRRFIQICAGTGAAALLPAGVFFLRGRERLTRLVHETLARHLPGTEIAPRDVAAYIHDFIEKNGGISGRARAFALLEPLARRRARHDPNLLFSINEFERDIVSGFLLGSDFFERGAGPGPVAYRGRGDEICRAANPFARFRDEKAG